MQLNLSPALVRYQRQASEMAKTGGAAAEPALSWPQSVAEFDALIEATQHRLIQFACCRLHSLADAEDVVQDVFVRAYRHRVRYRKVDNVVPFLFRMVANQATDLLRKRKRGERVSPLASPAALEAPVAEWSQEIEKLLE